jgi:hypothetical protein
MVSGRRKQAALFIILSLTLALFLAGYALLEEMDFQACRGNSEAALDGQRPFARIAEMPIADIVYAASSGVENWPGGELIVIAGLGFFVLSPFFAAWAFSRTYQSRRFWIACALLEACAIVAWLSPQELNTDCDYNGRSIGILVLPFLALLINLLVVVPILAFCRFLVVTLPNSE